MDQAEFQDWLPASDRLTAAQRAEAARTLSTDADEERSVAAVERGVGESRICPRCGEGGAVRKGMARGLRRYLCKSCGRTFNAVTRTPLQGLHKKERWLSFGESLAEGETVEASRSAAASRIRPPSDGGTGSWTPRGRIPRRCAGLWRRTRPIFFKAGKASEPRSGRPGGGCRAGRRGALLPALRGRSDCPASL